MSEHGERQGGFERLRRAATLVYLADLDALELEADDTHHLVHVLRLRDGAEVAVANGAGRYRFARLELYSVSASKGRLQKRLHLHPVSETLEEKAPVTPRTVGFALQKGERAELCVQKLTEVGIDRIVPVLTERTVVRLSPSEASARGDRLRKVAREAGRQSRRVRLPEVLDPRPFDDALFAEVAPVHLAEPGGALLGASVQTVFVGPEGGFSASERARGAGEVDLGETVLRAETAAIVVAALLVSMNSGRILPVGNR